jgi:2-oxoisovalerate dehydrogenase E2 component (dihydrolipoyl transacylase)
MMTDKATVEMESPVAGTIVEVAGEVGDQIAIGSVLVVIETEGAAGTASVEEGAQTGASGDRTDTQPLGDGMVDPTPGLEAVVPTADVEAEDRRTAASAAPATTAARKRAPTRTAARASGAPSLPSRQREGMSREAARREGLSSPRQALPRPLPQAGGEQRWPPPRCASARAISGSIWRR